MFARVCAAALLSAGLVGCGSADGPQTRPSAPPAPVESLNVESMELVRGDFCRVISTAAIKRAVGSAKADLTSWTNGQRLDIGNQGQVSQEFGCRWQNGAAAAAAWVFARPITAAEAATFAKGGRKSGCESTTTSFGVRRECAAADGVLVSYAGLVGDTYLTCEVSDANGATELATRAAIWCGDVATALDTSR